jgi:HNH endonuclease/NUMOD4 motif
MCIINMWKDIENFNYQISSDGQIRNKKTLKILALKTDKDGYKQIGLRITGDRTKHFFKVHRLVATYFIGTSDCQTDHIDGNRANNNVENLRWVDCATNNLNRKLTSWTTNSTKELYISEYKNGYMLRINRKDYTFHKWFKTFDDVLNQRNLCLEQIVRIRGVAIAESLKNKILQ